MYSVNFNEVFFMGKAMLIGTFLGIIAIAVKEIKDWIERHNNDGKGNKNGSPFNP